MIWKILSILALVLPMCAVVLGLLCWRYPPAGPTWAFGFRSRRARAGDASWVFAQEWAGKSWFLGGLAMLIATVVLCGKQKGATVETMLPAYLKLVAVQIGLLLLLVVVLNILLLVKFDRFGRRRKPRDKKGEPSPEPDDAEEESAGADDLWEDEPADGGVPKPGDYETPEYADDDPYEDAYDDSDGDAYEDYSAGDGGDWSEDDYAPEGDAYAPEDGDYALEEYDDSWEDFPEDPEE